MAKSAPKKTAAQPAVSGKTTIPPKALALLKAGRRIGLLGGSFNPAHGAHRHISLIALRRLKLDAVLWLVSPQNPLKREAGMAPLDARLERAAEVADHPRIFVTALERDLGTRYTVDTVKALRARYPRARFVWIMGGDNMAEFHRWRRWPEIARTVPIAVIARPGFTIEAVAAPAARRLQAARRRAEDAAQLAEATPPAWVFIEERLDSASATAIRAGGLWP